MRAAQERAIPTEQAINLVTSAFSECMLDVEEARWSESKLGVFGYNVLDPSGVVVATSAGKGRGRQGVASGLFEAWEHYWSLHGLSWLKDTKEVAGLSIEEVLEQPELHGETMLHRLAEDFPRAVLGCVRFSPVVPGRRSIWYPIFAKNPAFRRHLFNGDDFRYEPYARYASTNGTASGSSTENALLHAILEVAERDAVSFALIDWYATDSVHARRVELSDLPPDLQALSAEVGTLFQEIPVVLDITSDLEIPTYCALPPHDLTPYANNFGSGASLSRAYAAERALSELAQFTVVGRDPKYSSLHRRTIENAKSWPLIARCTVQDPRVPIDCAVPAVPIPPDDWDSKQGDVRDQLNAACASLLEAGHVAYWCRLDPDTTVPVVCVLVPGLDTFFLARQGVPVLPTGRATSKLLGQE